MVPSSIGEYLVWMGRRALPLILAGFGGALTALGMQLMGIVALAGGVYAQQLLVEGEVKRCV